MSHDTFPTDDPAVVTCGLPYANGDLHIGHLRGNIGADIYARALRRLGQQTAYVCGSDMHGTPIAVNAEQEGVDPEEFALRYHEQYEETFAGFNVDFQNYGHTRERSNVELTQEIVRTLDDRGYVYEKEILVAWDPTEEQPLPDRYVEGTCPYCGEKARGDECDEGCGRHLEPGEVEDPTSVVTGNPAEYRERTHKFFELSAFQEYLQEFIDRLEGTSNARNQPREWIEGELQDWCITRDMDWGIDYPEEGTDLVLYVWVDAPIEYVASTKDYSERVGRETYDWEQVWTDAGEIVHVIGPDIIQHHTVFWPAMLHGVDYNEPRAVMASGFVTLAGDGFSTSRNRAVWAREYLDEGFDPDALRYYLATQSGFQQDLDFSWEQFQERVNSDLVGTVGNFVYRSLLFAQRNYEGTPEAEVSDDVRHRIESAVDDFAAGVNDYSVRKVGLAVTDLARFGNEYIQRNEPWKLTDESPEEAAQVIRDCVQLVKAIAVLFQPIAPAAADRVWAQLNEAGSVADATLDDALTAPPATFDAPTELFEKVEDERVEELNEKLAERTEAAEEEAAGRDETDDTANAAETVDVHTDVEALADERIGFGDFQALDLRVGEIVSAEPIEGADELLRLEVDIGVETRQVVAGLRQLHDAESLPGTRVVLVANMEKAELFGTESNGMVLAAGEEADLLTTHGDAPLGTKIR
ncbi:methionine--tRNA ligase [Halomarina oriensis]|uniref:Methionine--tRNA ligase n=1 Tax=Halomarina oriensis TaxID=671145 RepID=A0A6B0GUS3_9EURY|nr:methionine--tRNA ligase [Halomarina oriensis]MWG35468.1 methionine--tRNA ligase [Halomarina oriensis]